MAEATATGATRSPRRRLARGLLALAVVVAGAGSPGCALTSAPAPSGPSAPASTASAPASATPSVAPGERSRQTSRAAPAAADRVELEKHLDRYLSKRSTTASVRVRDLVTGEVYSYRSGARYDSASIVKVAIMAAVLRRQTQQKRSLTDREVRLLRAMIRNSDNAATSALYSSLGRGPALAKFYKAAGMTRTKPGPAGYWGLTRVTAADQVVLLRHLAQPSKLLDDRSRAYARKLMASVTKSQAWGVSAGPARDGVKVALKNGWLPRSSRGWRVHSVGHVKGKGRNYVVAVLTVDSSTMARGVATVEGVSRIVYRDLAPQDE